MALLSITGSNIHLDTENRQATFQEAVLKNGVANSTHKSLLGVIFRNRGLRVESEYNAGHQPLGHKRLIEGAPGLFPVGWMNLFCVLIV